jgi:hypothetical protein
VAVWLREVTAWRRESSPTSSSRTASTNSATNFSPVSAFGPPSALSFGRRRLALWRAAAGPPPARKSLRYRPNRLLELLDAIPDSSPGSPACSWGNPSSCCSWGNPSTAEESEITRSLR